MPDYSKGKIYKIYDFTNKNVYYGSTTETLSRRMTNHVRAHKAWLKDKNKKKCSVVDIINNGNYKIILVENYPCKNKEELEKKETEYIINNECINKKLPRRTPRQYYLDNRNKILENKKKIIKDDDFKLRKSINDKKYRLTHREKVLNKKRQWSKNINIFYKSFGGSPYHDNMSLLKIDPTLFSV